MLQKKGMVDTMTKMTYVNAIDSAINGNITDEVREKLEALKVQLNKRNSGTRKPTKAQRENAELKDRVAEYLTHTLQGMKCGDIAAEFEVSGQKMSALLKQLVDEGRAEKYIEKRVTYFKGVAVE